MFNCSFKFAHFCICVLVLWTAWALYSRAVWLIVILTVLKQNIYIFVIHVGLCIKATSLAQRVKDAALMYSSDHRRWRGAVVRWWWCSTASWPTTIGCWWKAFISTASWWSLCSARRSTSTFTWPSDGVRHVFFHIRCFLIAPVRQLTSTNSKSKKVQQEYKNTYCISKYPGGCAGLSESQVKPSSGQVWDDRMTDRMEVNDHQHNNLKC